MSVNDLRVMIFAGGSGNSDIEGMLDRVRHGVLLDNLEKIINSGYADEVIVITAYPDIGEAAAKFNGVVVQGTWGRKFHFGKELKSVINNSKAKQILYLGGAGFPLFSEDDIEKFVAGLSGSQNLVLTNNPQSSDLVAFTPAEAINHIEPPPDDNSLAISLRDQAGLEMKLLPNTPGILYDIDTPTDMLILGGCSFAGSRATVALDGLSLDYTTFRRAKEVLEGYYREVAIIGRVGAPLIAHLNCNLKLRLRIFSEERGMKALGREASGQVESLLAYLITEVGLPKFFTYLEKVAEAAFIDTRVFLAHFNLKLPARDRYMSDLGRWEEVQNPWLREFTRLAMECSIPVMLGGHSLVSGGLWVIAEEIMGKFD